MKYSWNISDFVDDKNHQIVIKIACVLFNTQAKALMHNVYIFTFRNFILASLLHHKKALKGVGVEGNITTVELLQVADFFSISSDILKYWGKEVK